MDLCFLFMFFVPTGILRNHCSPQDSLLSRFDLLFVLLDTMDPENDLRISEHVVRMHRYRNPNEQDGEAMPLKNAADFLSTEDPRTATGDQTTEVRETQAFEGLE